MTSLCLLCFSTAQCFQQQNPTLILATRPHLLGREEPGCWGSPTCSDEDVRVPQQGGERRPLLALSGKQGLEEAARPPQRPPGPAAHLWLHPGRLEHKELNGYGRKKKRRGPKHLPTRMLSPRSPRSRPGVPGDSLTHLHPRAPGQPRPGTELSSPQTHTAHSQRGGPLRGRRSGAGTRPGLPTTPRPEPSSLGFSMRAQ